jgi:class 3 adenylate cyclase
LRALFIALSYLKGDYGAIHAPGEKILLYNKERGHNTVHANFNVFFILAARLKDTAKVRKRQIRKWKKKLERWARSAPQNYGPLNKVLDGLMQEKWGRGASAGEAYLTAYNLALTGENPFVLGIVAEEYGRYLYESAGERALGERMLREAFHTFGDWTATAKQAQLRERYPGVHFTAREASRSGKIVAQHLDLNSLLKASSTISREIRQQPLIERLLGVLIENAGAERAAFLVPDNDQLTVLAVKQEASDVEFWDRPVEPAAFPSRIIQFVWEKQEPLLLQDAVKDPTFGTDPYIREHQVHSVACFPLTRQDELKALIYLENKWTPRVFGPDRLELLELLSSQMTISYENAQLYEQLEEKVRDRTRALNEEKEKVDNLLGNIMPREVAEELKNQGRVRARRYEEVSVLFTDFRSFTRVAEELQAEELVELLDFYFSEFDRITLRHRLEKIKTIGDAYMCAGGIPNPGWGHLHRIMEAGLDIRDFVDRTRRERQAAGLPFFEIRVGIHIGPVVAGIVGHQKFAYDIWGETVNLASRMESNGVPGKINISQECYDLVKDDYACTFQGIFQSKGDNQHNMYLLERKA